MFFKVGVLENSAIFTGNWSNWSCRPATLLKRIADSDVFLCILQNFQDQLFYKTPPVADSDVSRYENRIVYNLGNKE